MKLTIDILKSNKFLVLGDQLIYSGLSFLTTIFLARFLTASDFGIYSTIIISVYLVISLGNAIIIQPFQVSDKSIKTSKSYSNFLFSSQIIFLALALIAAYILHLCIRVSDYHFLPLACMLSGIILHDYFRKYYLTTMEIVMVVIIDGIVVITQIAAVIYLYIVGYSGLESVFLLFGLSYILAVVFSIYCLKPRFQKFAYWKAFLQYHKKEGMWLGLVSFVQWGSANLFIVSLGLFISIEALGAFRLVQSMFGVLNILFQTFENYVLPNASRIYADSVSNSKAYIRKVSLQSALLIGLVLFVMFIFSKELMHLAIGEKYLEYSYVIKGMCILYFILFIGYPIRLCIRMLLLNKTFFIGYLLSFVFSILFFNYLLNHWQLNGVIFGLIINQLIMLVFWNYQLHLKKFYLWK
jgi:O-antigen/teichoic acid export membrane protein